MPFRSLCLVLLCVLAGASWCAKPVICLDPGHVSDYSSGTKGKFVSEVEVVYEIAVMLKPMLEKAGYQVVMTKKSVKDVVSNKRRAEIANEASADLFIRLHCDAGGKSQSGFATFYPDRKGKKDGVTGPSDAVIKESKTLAPFFHAAAVGVLKGSLGSAGVKPESRYAQVATKQGALTGSIFSKVPVLLTEICYLSNPKDENFIRTAKGKKLMAEALLKGIQAAVPVRK